MNLDSITDKIKDSFGEEAADINGLVVTGVALASSLLVKRLLGYTWKKTMKADPPKNPAADDVSFGEALAWTIMTGVFAALVKVLVRRNVVVGARKAK